MVFTRFMLILSNLKNKHFENEDLKYLKYYIKYY